VAGVAGVEVPQVVAVQVDLEQELDLQLHQETHIQSRWAQVVAAEQHIILELHQAAQEMDHQVAIQCSIILHLLVAAVAAVEMITLAIIQDLAHLVVQVVVAVADHCIHNQVVQEILQQQHHLKETMAVMVQVMLVQHMVVEEGVALVLLVA
jgi:hypothetical protein